MRHLEIFGSRDLEAESGDGDDRDGKTHRFYEGGLVGALAPRLESPPEKLRPEHLGSPGGEEAPPVERRDNVTGIAAVIDELHKRTHEDRLRVWIALGGTEADFPEGVVKCGAGVA